MNTNITWTPEAESTFQAQLDYLTQTWPEMSLRKFIDRVYEVVNHVGTHPDMYPAFQGESSVHYCEISPYTTLYYQMKGEQINLLTFWPMEQVTEKNGG